MLNRLCGSSIGAVEELEVTMDGEDFTWAVFVIHGRGAVCFKIPKTAVETDRKEVERWCVI